MTFSLIRSVHLAPDQKEEVPRTVRSISRVPGEIPSVYVAQAVKRAWFQGWLKGLRASLRRKERENGNGNYPSSEGSPATPAGDRQAR